jgi:hypothetical protein
MSNGHHDGMRGIAGANCAYIAQSYGASIQEIETAPMQTSKSGWRRRLRYVRYVPTATNARPPTQANAMDAVIRGVNCALSNVALLVAGASSFGVETEHQAEDEQDQSEQRAQHYEFAHDCTLLRPPD